MFSKLFQIEKDGGIITLTFILHLIGVLCPIFKYLFRAHSQPGAALADGNRALGKSQPTNNTDTYPCPCEIRMTNIENKFNYMMRSAFHMFHLACIKYIVSKEKFTNTPIPRVVHPKYCNSLQINILDSNFIPQNV